MQNELLRQLPSINELIESAPVLPVINDFGLGAVKFAARQELASVREKILSNNLSQISEHFHEAIRERLVQLTSSEGRHAINATGILLHTGLGRAPFSDAAKNSLALASHYSVLQTDRDTGKRCLREANIEAMLRELTGCEAATVVNNNAAATMLILNSVARDKEVVVSRGQLIEIGGAFRMTDVMKMSGCELHEVGCTNRTHLRDYETAIGENTGALIHVHTSNFRVRGFSSTPDISELTPLGKKHNLPVIDDLGSGALVPLSKWGITDEPLVADSIKAGADVICFSGDKLICGPQSGIICGRKDLIKAIRKNPFSRMFRVCKLTLAALETSLMHFINEDYETQIPFYKALSKPADDIKISCDELAASLSGCSAKISVIESSAFIGSGSIPDEEIPSYALSVKPENIGINELARRLRSKSPSVFGRIHDGELVFDLRTVFDDEMPALTSAISGALE